MINSPFDYFNSIFDSFKFHWSEDYFSFKKRDDEFTPEEKKQITKNEKILKQLEKEDKQFFQLSDEERKKLGYKSVEDYHKGGGYEDAETNLCRLLSKQLKEVLIDAQEESNVWQKKKNYWKNQ